MNIAIIILLVLILLANVAMFTLAYIVVSQIKIFIVPAEEGKPSPLSASLQVLSDMVGRSIVATLKATFMGKQSGLVRGEQAVAGDIAVDNVANSPVGAILQSFPSLSKTLKRNPALLDIALGFLNKGQSNSPISSGSNGEKPRFNLGR